MAKKKTVNLAPGVDPVRPLEQLLRSDRFENVDYVSTTRPGLDIPIRDIYNGTFDNDLLERVSFSSYDEDYDDDSDDDFEVDPMNTLGMELEDVYDLAVQAESERRSKKEPAQLVKDRPLEADPPPGGPVDPSDPHGES